MIELTENATAGWCRVCGEPFKPSHDIRSPGGTVRHSFMGTLDPKRMVETDGTHAPTGAMDDSLTMDPKAVVELEAVPDIRTEEQKVLDWLVERGKITPEQAASAWAACRLPEGY